MGFSVSHAVFSSELLLAPVSQWSISRPAGFEAGFPLLVRTSCDANSIRRSINTETSADLLAIVFFTLV